MSWSIVKNASCTSLYGQKINENVLFKDDFRVVSNLSDSPERCIDKEIYKYRLDKIPIYLSQGRPLKDRVKSHSILKNNERLIQLNRKIALLAVEGDFAACKVSFDKIKNEGLIPDTYSYNPIISMLFRKNKPQTALFLLKEMQQESIPSDIETCNQLMFYFKRNRDLEAAKVLLEEMGLVGILPNIKTYYHLMGLYASQQDLKGAKALLDEMQRAGVLPSVSTYFVLMQLYTNPLDLLNERVQAGIKPDITIYNALLKSFLAKDNLPCAKAALAAMEKAGIGFDIDTYNILLKCYAKDGVHVLKMHTILEEMRERNIKPDKTTYSTVMQFCMNKGNPEVNMELLKELQRAGILAGVISCNILMHFFMNNGYLKEANVLLEEMRHEDALSCVATYNTLMDLYVNNGNLDAQKLLYMKSINTFDRMFTTELDKNIGDNESSKVLFEEMQQAGILPKTETFETLIEQSLSKGSKRL